LFNLPPKFPGLGLALAIANRLEELLPKKSILR
jgi:hypothetical protein